MMRFPKSYADRVARFRVPSGFLLVIAFALLADPTLHSIAIGAPVSMVGLAIRAWAAGHLEKNRELTVSGPYAYVRNPLYGGTLLVAAGLVIATRRVELALLFAAVFVFVYLPVIELEEQHLRKLFAGSDGYAATTPLLLPRGRTVNAREPFRFSLYRRNEEYQAALGYLAGLAWLVWRATN